VKAPNYDRGLAIIASVVLVVPVAFFVLLDLLGQMVPE
jgi:hypothetical protein